MKVQTHNVVIVAHPDDETLFFGGLICSSKDTNWSVIVVTDANADGMGIKRRQQLDQACQLLGVENIFQWDFPDRYEERLDQERLKSKLSKFVERQSKIDNIFTHGPAGEYAHPHHQDVSLAVHSFFLKEGESNQKVWSVAYNSLPELIVNLTREQYERKREVLMGPYHSEVSRFMNLLPCTWSEGFHRLSLKEVKATWLALTTGNLPSPEELNEIAPHYGRYLEHLQMLYLKPPKRPF